MNEELKPLLQVRSAQGAAQSGTQPSPKAQQAVAAPLHTCSRSPGLSLAVMEGGRQAASFPGSAGPLEQLYSELWVHKAPLARAPSLPCVAARKTFHGLSPPEHPVHEA